MKALLRTKEISGGVGDALEKEKCLIWYITVVLLSNRVENPSIFDNIRQIEVLNSCLFVAICKSL